VTRERTLPALEAAHLRPFAEGGEHEASNGVLLRRDIHSLFDAGYVTITPDLHFEVNRRIKEEFENGRQYYELHGREIALPDDGEPAQIARRSNGIVEVGFSVESRDREFGIERSFAATQKGGGAKAGRSKVRFHVSSETAELMGDGAV